jgi:glucose-1-phosphate adenylyltransferase
MAVKKDIVAMVLAGGRVDELSVLTAMRPKSAVPIWGMYRIIDFVLSNMMNSGIDVVGVLSQYRPYSLTSHLAGGAPWDYLGRTRELRILSPYRGARDTDWYRGTADAVFQNLNFLAHYRPELTLIASGDHVYAMDYRPLVKQHLARNAALTIAFTPVPWEMAPNFGTAELADDGRVLVYEEKAAKPRGNFASMTVYLFNTAVLEERIRQNAAEGRTFQIYAEVIPRMVTEGEPVYGYVFDGYWQYARTIASYYATNMDMLSPTPPALASWRVRTNLALGVAADPPPVIFQSGAAIAGAFVSAGAVLKGEVSNSIISPGVVIERGAIVRDSIVMHGSTVAAGAVLDRAILDKEVVIGAGARVGSGEPASQPAVRGIVTEGLTVIGKDARIPAGIVIGRDCIVAPETPAECFPAREVRSGTMVRP